MTTVFQLPNILDAGLLAEVRQVIADAPFVDGMQTAGEDVAHVKRNEQVAFGSEAHRVLGEQIRDALTKSTDFQNITQARNISHITFSRYGSGMHYGDHSDHAFMRGGRMRSDISFTIFLNDPGDYEGGELVMNTDIRPEGFKLPAGHILIYPTLVLHRVDPIISGERLVAVGWVESWVRDPNRRQILLDLTQTLGALKRSGGANSQHLSLEFIRLDKVYQNLLRMWAND